MKKYLGIFVLFIIFLQYGKNSLVGLYEKATAKRILCADSR